MYLETYSTPYTYESSQSDEKLQATTSNFPETNYSSDISANLDENQTKIDESGSTSGLQIDKFSVSHRSYVTHTSFFTALSSSSFYDTFSPSAHCRPKYCSFLLPTTFLSCLRQIRLLSLIRRSGHKVRYNIKHTIPIDDDFLSIGDESSIDEPSSSTLTHPLQSDGISRSCSQALCSSGISDVSKMQCNSYKECLELAVTMVGKWATILERSESLDAQYKHLGLNTMKRMVLNRLSIQLTMFLEENDTILHCWIHTPLGIRHMRSSLCGCVCVDEDPDAGRWEGTTQTIDYYIPWYSGGKTVRALQQTRHNHDIGISIETRCILPDSLEGKILLFNFVMIPKNSTIKLSADRLLRYVDKPA